MEVLWAIQFIYATLSLEPLEPYTLLFNIIVKYVLKMYRSMKDDPDTNVQFVQTVEMFPCLYDYTTKEYSNRNAQDKAWGEIGKNLTPTVRKKKLFNIIHY